MDRINGVDGLVNVAGEEMTRAAFERRSPERPRLLRIYELESDEA